MTSAFSFRTPFTASLHPLVAVIFLLHPCKFASALASPTDERPSVVRAAAASDAMTEATETPNVMLRVELRTSPGRTPPPDDAHRRMPAHAIDPMQQPRPKDLDSDITSMLGTRLLTMTMYEATAEMIADALAEGLGVPVIVFTDDEFGIVGGILPDERVQFSFERIDARDALDVIAGLFDDFDVTWQVVDGRIEIGPRFMLARESMRRTRVLPIHDLVMDIPGAHERRRTPEEVARGLMAQIRESVDPDVWVPDPAVRLHLERTGEIENELQFIGAVASLSYADGRLTATAPPYVLRQISSFAANTRSSWPPQPDGIIRRSGLRETRTPGDAHPPMTLRGFVPSGRHPRAPRERDATRAAAIESLGRLMHSRVDVDIHGETVREAINALVQETGATLRVFWKDDQRERSGVDPDRRIRLRMNGISGLSALELIFDIADPDAQTTWQITGPMVEAGPRSVMVRSGAQRTEVYGLEDILIDVPRFALPGSDSGGEQDYISPLERRHGRQLGISRNDGSQGVSRRKSMDFRTAEFLLFIAAQVEPLAWIPILDDKSDKKLRTTRDEVDDPLQLQGQWASARPLRRGQLIVRAPDFIHRKLAGEILPPSPADR